MQIDLLQFPKIKRELGKRTEAHRVIARRFDRDFFDGSRDTGYGGYHYDGRWAAVAQRMKQYYGLQDHWRVLDVGCAKGFLVHEFRKIKIDAMGLDVSGYALANAYGDVGKFLMHRGAQDIPEKEYELIVSINTLHNLDRAELCMALRVMQARSLYSYITVDAYETDEQRERMEAWNLTAKTILHVNDWLTLFDECGYTGDYDWFMP